jgi:hypothetical protein
LRDPDRLRNHAFDLISLAAPHLVTAEPNRAVELIVQALPLAHTPVPGVTASQGEPRSPV